MPRALRPVSRFMVLIIGAAALAALADAAKAQPQIESVTPSDIMVNEPIGRELYLRGTNLIPSGVKGYDVVTYVKPFMKHSSQGSFVPAEVVIPGKYGYSPAAFAVRVPSGVVSSIGSLQIKIVTAGVESNVVSIPIVAAGTPQITSIYPHMQKLGSEYVDYGVRITGRGIYSGTMARFQGVDIVPHPTDYTHRGGESELLMMIPQQFRGKPGRYTVQLVNDKGYSNLKWWELAGAPQITGVSPSRIPGSSLEPNAAPLTVKVSFASTPPSKAMARIDGGAWFEAQPPRISGSSIEFPLQLATLRPKKTVEIKLQNSAGDSPVHTLQVPVVAERLTRGVTVSTSGIAQTAIQPPAPSPTATTNLRIAQMALATTQVFTAPVWNNKRVDLCLIWGGQCGEPAANEFCKRSGFTEATAWTPANDIGGSTPTVVLGTGQTCSLPSCDGFASITCSR